MFVLPSAPTGKWEDLTENEKSWIEFIRVVSLGRDPKPTPERVSALTDMLDRRGN